MPAMADHRPPHLPPLPDDGLYRAILMVLVVSVMVGAVVALAGELVWHDKGIAHAGAWMALICGGLYFVFRLLGKREMRRRAAREDRERDGERGGDRGGDRGGPGGPD